MGTRQELKDQPQFSSQAYIVLLFLIIFSVLSSLFFFILESWLSVSLGSRDLKLRTEEREGMEQGSELETRDKKR